ncbi:hypothetical protein C9J12_29160 [Photobacterium frigidiphilum]|jgi:hypothetical protein|uniref:Uncharacterized protein n=1 Tax=Photobacterium frigidiphilum TaxID=264736 RepID=A0A2T3J5Z1_9GAMM|nr:hypothetical protein [Photobacterium frigidiphilum]PSU42144.1 hypothetical protein C9J12_29160 [Photobacterium frigidiphilum]
MARNPVVQVACEPELYKKIDDYQKEKGIQSKAEAVRELIDFAFRVLEHSSEEEAVSMRVLMEKVLELSTKNLYMQNNIYFQTYNEEKYSGDHSTSNARKRVTFEKAEEFVERFLAGEEKEGDK